MGGREGGIAYLLQAYVPTRALRSAGAKHNHSVGARAFMDQYTINHKNVASLARFRKGLIYAAFLNSYANDAYRYLTDIYIFI